jgi:hypothetical protein
VAIGLNGFQHIRMLKSSTTCAAALLFATFLCVVVFEVMLPVMHHVISFYSPVSQRSYPLLWIVDFLTQSCPKATLDAACSNSYSLQRLCICIYWIICLVVFLPICQHICQTYSQYIPQIASRKLFHFLSVLMFTPMVRTDAEMMLLSFAVALCGLLLIEYIRCEAILNC